MTKHRVSGRKACHPNIPARNPLFHEWEMVEEVGGASVWQVSKATCSRVPYVTRGRIAWRLLECVRAVLLRYCSPHVPFPHLSGANSGSLLVCFLCLPPLPLALWSPLTCMTPVITSTPLACVGIGCPCSGLLLSLGLCPSSGCLLCPWCLWSSVLSLSPQGGLQGFDSFSLWVSGLWSGPVT